MRRIVLLSWALLALSACGLRPVAAEEETVLEKDSVVDAPASAAPATEEAPDLQLETPRANPYRGFAANADRHPTLVGITRGDTQVFPNERSTSPELTVPSTTILGTASVLTSVGQPVNGRLEVMLPGRPNGRTGWIEMDSVDLYVVGGKIVVDLSDRQLTYWEGNVARLTTPVAVGTDTNPTPAGHFFVTDSVELADPNSPWGPNALGLSGRSDTITEFNGGDGIIGIHGTNKPDSIGKAASLGCVRLPNDVISELAGMVPLGTPVEIRN